MVCCGIAARQADWRGFVNIARRGPLHLEGRPAYQRGLSRSHFVGRFFGFFVEAFYYSGPAFRTSLIKCSKRALEAIQSHRLFLGSLMPRQPLTRVIPLADKPKLLFGIACPEKRPQLTTLVGKILLAWPHVESHMAVVLGQILGTDSEPALAVYEILRRSSNQREAIETAARIKLSARDQELLSAILGVHKSIEADRNAFAHGHIGWTNALPDALLWITTSDYIRFILHVQNGMLGSESELYEPLSERTFVYTLADLSKISTDVREIWRTWLHFGTMLMSLLRYKLNGDEQYNQLCAQSRIARELAILRQKNRPSTQSQTPP